MNTKLLIAVILCSTLVVPTESFSVELLGRVLLQSNQLLTKFEQKYPIMKGSIGDLKLGLLQALNYKSNEKDLEDQYPCMYEINRRYESLPPNAVDNLSTFSALRLVPYLKKLNGILPPDQAAFRANMIAFGGFGPMLGKACSPLNSILDIIS